jgi:hypothetical protein
MYFSTLKPKSLGRTIYGRGFTFQFMWRFISYSFIFGVKNAYKRVNFNKIVSPHSTIIYMSVCGYIVHFVLRKKDQSLKEFHKNIWRTKNKFVSLHSKEKK